MLRSNHVRSCIMALCLIPINSLSLGSIHFYSATPRFSENRFEKNKLSSLDLIVSKGTSNQGRNDCGHKTNALDIYGTHNMHALGKGIPLDATNNFDSVLQELAILPKTDHFAELSFSGTFQVKQLNLFLTQNLKRGLFFQWHIPAQWMSMQTIQWTDLSPSAPTTPNKDNATWQSFLNQFTPLLSRYALSLDSYTTKGAGDMELLFGWTKNYQDTTYLDFIDTTIKGGISIPTGKTTNIHHPFCFPFGHDGHIGIPLSIDMSFGLFDWITLSTYFETTLLRSKTKTIRIKTDSAQSGMIKLAQTTATVYPGNTIQFGSSITADHVLFGFSCSLGYGFSYQGDTRLALLDTRTYSSSIANDDPMLKKWYRHTMHIQFEYDFASEERHIDPRIGIIYNWDIGGKRTFNCSTGGMNLGIEVDVSF